MDRSNLWILIYDNIQEIEEIIDSRVNIDNNGDPNTYMKIKEQLDNLKQNLERLNRKVK